MFWNGISWPSRKSCSALSKESQPGMIGLWAIRPGENSEFWSSGIRGPGVRVRIRVSFLHAVRNVSKVGLTCSEGIDFCSIQGICVISTCEKVSSKVIQSLVSACMCQSTILVSWQAHWYFLYVWESDAPLHLRKDQSIPIYSWGAGRPHEVSA